MRLIKCLIIFLPIFVAFGQGAEMLTLDDCVNIGLKNSKSLYASEMTVVSARAKANEIGVLRLPSLKFSAGYVRLSDVPPFAVQLPFSPPMPTSITISEPILDNYSLKLTLQQPLFAGLKMQYAAKAAKMSYRAAKSDFAKDNCELIFNIKNAYWTLFKAQRGKAVIDENVLQIESHLRDVKNFLEDGLATNNDVLKVGVQLSNAKLMQIDAKNAVELADLSLKNVIGIPLNDNISISDKISDTRNIEITDLGESLDSANANRAELKSLEYRIVAAKANLSMSHAGWFPQIGLIANYNYAKPNQRIQPPVDEFDETWDVGVAAGFDVWNWGTTHFQTKQASAQLAQAKDALEQLKNAIALEVTQNYLSLKKAEEKIGVAQTAKIQAAESHRITQDNFKSGLAVNSDLLDAEVALLQANLNFTNALVDYEIAKARFEKSLGK
jgi:outer membrane protein TolC